MKMIRNSSRRFSTTCTLALAFVFLGAYTDSASAQAVQWRFVISSQTQWGNVTLPPGNYTFSINAPGPFARVVLQRNEPGVPASMISSVSCGEISVSATDSLVIVRNGEGTAVRELHLASMGLVFHFPAGKAETTSTSAAVQPGTRYFLKETTSSATSVLSIQHFWFRTRGEQDGMERKYEFDRTASGKVA